VATVDTSMLVLNMKVNDVSDQNYTKMLIFFIIRFRLWLFIILLMSVISNITDMKVLYNDQDKFYRYTTGKFATKEEASVKRAELISKGYPEEIFIKKVSKQ